ncbi:MAG: sulfotransferase family 2 domain-containing protein [Neptuniibacter sp.]
MTQNSVFIWIPKNAGTSFSIAIGAEKFKTLDDVKSGFQNQGRVTFVHMDYARLVKEGYVTSAFDQTAFKYCFVRNPYDRAVSLYKYLMKVNRLKYLSWSLRIKEKFFSRGNIEISFLEFCRLLSEYEVEPVGLYSSKRVNHCNPQVRWIENLDMDFIGRFENLDNDTNRVFEELGLQGVEMIHENRSNDHGYEGFYCQESKEIIEHLYHEDFSQFGYERQVKL